MAVPKFLSSLFIVYLDLQKEHLIILILFEMLCKQTISKVLKRLNESRGERRYDQRWIRMTNNNSQTLKMHHTHIMFQRRLSDRYVRLTRTNPSANKRNIRAKRREEKKRSSKKSSALDSYYFSVCNSLTPSLSSITLYGDDKFRLVALHVPQFMLFMLFFFS